MCVFHHVRNFMDAPAPGAPIYKPEEGVGECRGSGGVVALPTQEMR